MFEMKSVIFQGHTRHDLGTAASRRLRRLGKLPAIIYGAEKEPQPIFIEHNKFIAAEIAGNLFNNLLTVDVDGKKESVIIKDLQRHPFKPLFIHVDFLRINKKEEVTVTVPIEVVGDEELLKLGAVITKSIHELEILCLPDDIPTSIEVDISSNVIGDTITLNDINFNKSLTVKLLVSNEEATDWSVINIEHPKSLASDEDETSESIENLD